MSSRAIDGFDQHGLPSNGVVSAPPCGSNPRFCLANRQPVAGAVVGLDLAQLDTHQVFERLFVLCRYSRCGYCRIRGLPSAMTCCITALRCSRYFARNGLGAPMASNVVRYLGTEWRYAHENSSTARVTSRRS